jgi:predicted dienelactone hydrolase
MRFAARATPIVFCGVLAGCVPAADDAARTAGVVEERWWTWHDAARGRDVAVRLFLPQAETARAAPLVLFSHGVGESILSYAYLGRRWAADGLAVLFVEHPGSDVHAVDWNAVTPSLIRAARDPANWLARIADVRFALERVGQTPELMDRVDTARVAAAGHSLGAHTALALAGMTIELETGDTLSMRDPRITACVALSPPAAGMLGVTEASWAGVTPPLLTIFGTRDGDVILKDSAARRAVFDGAVHADRWLVVLADVEHTTFTGRDPDAPFSSDAQAQQERIAALSAAWLRTMLLDAPPPPAALHALLTEACGSHCTVESADGE